MPKENDIEKYAVIIGVGSYPGQNIGSDGDARLMIRMLRDYGFSNRNVHSLINSKGTYESIREETEWLCAIDSPDAEIIWFFSGHGGPGCITSADGFSIKFTSIRDWLSVLESQKQLVIVAACFSGTALPILEQENRIVISSTLPDEYGYTDNRLGSWGHVFLEQGMWKKKADANGDGLVSIQEAASYCYEVSDGKVGMISDMYGQEFLL